MPILGHKNKGETPLEFLDRLRVEKPNIASEKLSYAGRLDPMASGEMLVLIGDENKSQEKYFKYSKEYIATFINGISTDTGDSLGLITNIDIGNVEKKQLETEVQKIKKLGKQKFPWFSAKTIAGKKLFEHFKSGNLDVERPIKNIQILESELLEIKKNQTEELVSYIVSSIDKVNGDFRQEEIKKGWLSLPKVPVQIFKVRFVVSSGTYIRALTEEFPFPTCLLDLNRTKILMPKNLTDAKHQQDSK